MAAEKDDGYIRFQCPNCGRRLKMRNTYEGGNVIPCPRCQSMVVTPMGNLDAIVGGQHKGQAEWLNKLNVDPDTVLTRLQAEGVRNVNDAETVGPRPEPGAPVRPSGPIGLTKLARIKELDQLDAAITKINDESMGRVQKIYREEGLTSSERAEQIKEMADWRKTDLRKAFRSVMTVLRRDLAGLESRSAKLSRAEGQERLRLRAALEAVQLYGRFVHGLDI